MYVHPTRENKAYQLNTSNMPTITRAPNIFLSVKKTKGKKESNYIRWYHSLITSHDALTVLPSDEQYVHH